MTAAQRIPFLDLRVTDEAERQRIHEAVEKVLQHGRIVLGPEVAELERRVAERVGRAHAVGVNSGTDALIVSLRALGIGPGDEVIVPPQSFIATANAVSIVGAEPVFADMDDDGNLDPDSIQALLSPRTRAIMPVHWAGRPCDMDRILAIAAAAGVPVIEDSSQAFDSERHGRKAGSFGRIGCFSMNAMKVFASLGEAGMIVTDDPDLYEKCVALRYHGLVNREYCTQVSQNGRLDTLQAAILLTRLDFVTSHIDIRRDIAAFYNDKLADVVAVPSDVEGGRHVYYTYTIRTPHRDALKAHLEARGVEVKIQHPLLMPQHPVYNGRAKGSWPNAERMVPTVLCLPCHEKIDQRQRAYVAESVLSFFATLAASAS